MARGRKAKHKKTKTISFRIEPIFEQPIKEAVRAKIKQLEAERDAQANLPKGQSE